MNSIERHARDHFGPHKGNLASKIHWRESNVLLRYNGSVEVGSDGVALQQRGAHRIKEDPL